LLVPNTIRRLLRGACLAAFVLTLPASAGALSLSGSYLAAMQADFRNDYETTAAYLSRALTADPDNIALLQNAIVANVATGDILASARLAERLAARMPENQVAALVRVADAFAREDYDRAATLLEEAGAEMNPLLGGLLAGWIEVGREDFAAAQERFDALDANDTLKAYGQYHKALALAFAGDFVTAATIMEGDERGPLHVNLGAIVARAQILAQIDREAEALEILDRALSGSIPNEIVLELRDAIAAGEEVPFNVVTGARGGAAEAYFTLAEALAANESERIGLVHARLAIHIDPDAAEPRLLAAEVLEMQSQYALASAVLADLPEASPWHVSFEIRRANTQRSAGDPEGGIATLAALAASHPDRIEVQSALADALRVDERYPEAAEAYGRAIDLIETPMPAHWVLYYTRAIAHERGGDWDAAEADFRQALELQPDQPLVLNYLGYSLVEQRRNLDEALDMIERAVAGQPDDGYITDSLGWVYYRLGRFDEAVDPMLRAVELVPDDAVLNDHLGDVLWKVGRTREAEFQWRRALSLGPADDLDMERIRRKLEIGLDRVLEEEAAQDG
jgi:tetratricopeptide (TPR) repeat protein